MLEIGEGQRRQCRRPRIRVFGRPIERAIEFAKELAGDVVIPDPVDADPLVPELAFEPEPAEIVAGRHAELDAALVDGGERVVVKYRLRSPAGRGRIFHADVDIIVFGARDSRLRRDVGGAEGGRSQRQRDECNDRSIQCPAPYPWFGCSPPGGTIAA